MAKFVFKSEKVRKSDLSSATRKEKASLKAIYADIEVKNNAFHEADVALFKELLANAYKGEKAVYVFNKENPFEKDRFDALKKLLMELPDTVKVEWDTNAEGKFQVELKINRDDIDRAFDKAL